jgi:hypothetical protein
MGNRGEALRPVNMRIFPKTFLDQLIDMVEVLVLPIEGHLITRNPAAT